MLLLSSVCFRISPSRKTPLHSAGILFVVIPLNALLHGGFEMRRKYAYNTATPTHSRLASNRHWF